MTPITRVYGEAEHSFDLTPEAILELERTTGTGIGALCKRLFAGQFGLADIQHTIRLALIGAGKDPKQAADLVTSYTALQPLEASFELAVAILEALYFGKNDDGQD